MAKAGIALNFTAYSRRDPVTGSTKTFLRNAHSRQSSANLKEFQSCVAKGMRGVTVSGATPQERARAIREKFASTASSCGR